MVSSSKKVILSDLVERGTRRKCRNVATNAGFFAITFDDHGSGIPAHKMGDPSLDGEVSGIGRLFLNRNGVDVRRLQRSEQASPPT